MAEWVSHLIVADRVLERLPQLKRHEFCVGNIAPDCNRDTKRVAAAWARAKAIPELRQKSEGMTEDWDSFKKLFEDRKDRLKDFFVIEREYLDEHPKSGYFTEIIMSFWTERLNW